MKKMRRLEWLIVLGMATLGGLVGAQADTLTWSGGATTEGDFTAPAMWWWARRPWSSCARGRAFGTSMAVAGIAVPRRLHISCTTSAAAKAATRSAFERRVLR